MYVLPIEDDISYFLGSFTQKPHCKSETLLKITVLYKVTFPSSCHRNDLNVTVLVMLIPE